MKKTENQKAFNPGGLSGEMRACVTLMLKTL